MDSEQPLRTVVDRRETTIGLLLSVVAMLAIWLGAAASPAKAWETAAGFQCGTLDPAWTGNYRCDSPDNISGYGVDYVFINTYERAGCVDYADVWHNLKASWVCYSKGTELGPIAVRQDGGWYRGAIRNNNLTYPGNFNGVVVK